MYFITNRASRESNGSLVFPVKNGISKNLLYCKRTPGDKRSFQEIGSESFMNEVIHSPGEILFFIHGFNNQPYNKVFPRAKKLKEQFKNHSLSHVKVVPLIWPSDNDEKMIKDYFDDQKWAAQSASFFAKLIHELLQQKKKNPSLNKVHVLAHSMGGRLLMKTLAHWAAHHGAGEVPQLFENIYLIASDIENEALEKNREGYHITTAGKRVYVYYALDDIALFSSSATNVKNSIFSRRLGQSGPESMREVSKNVYAVNCNTFNHDFNKVRGHTYYIDVVKNGRRYQSPAFDHIAWTLKTEKHELGKRKVKLKSHPDL